MMVEWLKLNYETIIIVAVLLFVVALIIRGIINDRKKGKHICGGNCGTCAAACSMRKPGLSAESDFPNRHFKISVKIDGMVCGMCEAHVNEAFRSRLELEKIVSDAKKGETTIISSIPYSEKRLKEILEPTGYRVVSSSIIPVDE